MRTHIPVVFFFIIMIFGLPGAFAPSDEEEEETQTKKPYDLQAGKQVFLTLLDYINGIGALAKDPSYDSIKKGIDDASDLGSLIEAGKNILYHSNTEKNLLKKGKENVNDARVMKEAFNEYMMGYWTLLNKAGLDGGHVPMGKKLREMIAELDAVWLGHPSYGTDDMYIDD